MEAEVYDTYYKRHLNQFRQNVGRKQLRYNTIFPTMTSRSRVSEIHGLDGSKIKNFPFSSFKLLGGLQIGIGATCLLLGILDLFLYLYMSNQYDDETLSGLTIATAPVWCGLWFIVSGSMGSCMSLEQKNTLSYFKTTFMVLSILCCILFGPALCAVEIYIVILRTDNSTAAYEWLLPLLIAFFGFNEIICAAITASIGCCCSPLNQAKVRVVYTRQLNEYDEPMEEKPRRLQTPEIFYTENARMERSQRAPVHHRAKQHDANDNQETNNDDNWDGGRSARSSVKQPRAIVSAGSPVMTHYSRPSTDGEDTYRKLKQLALPGNPDRF